MVNNKKDVIRLLERIALFLELKGENPFKINAYRRAAQGLERDERSLSEIDDFTKIRGIGKGTNAVIVEYIKNHTSETLAELEKDIPESLLSLLHIPGLGGKRIATLYQELQITDIESLKKACQDGSVGTLPGFGKKTVENILSALDGHDERPERLPIAIMLPVAEKIEAYLCTIPEIERFSRAGSLRRMKEMIKDLDFVIATSNPDAVKTALLEIDDLKEIIAQGDTKVSITIEDVYPINIDFRLVTNDEYVSALHHFTGSKDHNVAMRQLAKANGEKINEYGIINEETEEITMFDSEEAFFKHFKLNYIPPEVRENTGEVDAFKNDIELIKDEDIRGDLHMHTTWSDGAHSIEEMVEHAIEIGYEYIAITDHSKFLRVANGLNETRLRRQQEEIARLNETYKDIHIFSGVEMDILPDGTLDFSDEFLKELDIVIAAIHSGFNQSEEDIMKRLYTALDNPFVDIVAHPTGRIIGKRDGYAADVEKLIEKARKTDTVLEINANPNRLDLSPEWVRIAEENGVTLAINTDAHSYLMYPHMKYGVSVAKKGWLRKNSVLNTWPTQKLIQYLQRNK